MSALVMVAVFFGGLAVLVGLSWCIVDRVVCGEWAWHYFNKKKKSPKERRSEIGTIRIVEKMREDESVYYIAERYDWYYGSLQWAQYPLESGRFDTPEEAQEAANTEFEKEQKKAEKKAEKKRRANYEKVMGEFKP